MAPNRTLLVVFFTIFLDLVGFGIIIPIQPFYAESFGASPAVVTLLGASYSLMQFLFAPLWGRLSDRVGRRPVILVSVATSAVGFSLFALADDLVLLFAARILAGVGNANVGTAQAVIADTTSAQGRARGMGLVGAAFGLGFICGPALGGAFGQVSLETPAWVAAGLAAVNWGLAWFLLPETYRPGAAREAGGGLGLSAAALRQVTRHPGVTHLAWILFVGPLAFALMEQVIGLYIERAHVAGAATHDDALKEAAARTTQMMVAVGVTATLVQGALIGRLAARFGEQRLIVAGTLLLAASLAAVPLSKTAGSFALLVADAVLIAFGNSLLNPSLMAALSRSVGADEQGTTLGVGQSLAALGRVFGPLGAGLLFEAHYVLPFAAAGALMAGCALVAVRRGVGAAVAARAD